ncbi:MAG: flagellar FlbD family protein [Mobiluncus porci]|uniref:Flagellar FlbD family protein n=1 Tax=Mobiluncus porci TaxID=2652278 RepID=A0A7K0K3E6_9ACTO|nr:MULTISPECIES: flagellar FlbD family protein [Mobiluncus]MCI6584708.1 flagellar FlbD family protein [Mobiluncus sp.]MDD7540985.1 flagellar FlbD family protein [Mobiluncus porci]MDY5748160.1 flagellar FlbD family protein [Mobiluncus porci]MST50006.1 flagellar FlbD family protein [Mobiluncus porci]
MIALTRLGGSEFVLNPDLIERIESAPDTIIVMVDATRYIVEQTATEVIELIREDRARLLARVEELIQEDSHKPSAPVKLSVAYSAKTVEE